MLPWPLVAIDFEASSLDQDGYPIEVGLALWPALDQPILGWSTLIRPAWNWTRNGHWSPASAKVHGICGRDLLERGQEPVLVAAGLNAALGSGAVAWCDGGAYDAHWMQALFKGKRPAKVALFCWRETFVLRSWITLSTMEMLPVWQPLWLPQTLLRCLALKSSRSVGDRTMQASERAF